MTKNLASQSTVNDALQPISIMAGLGSADRELVSTCLALFDDGRLSRRLNDVFQKSKKLVPFLREKAEIDEVAESVQSRMEFWQSSDLVDSDLRLTLWLYLRSALGLDQKLTCSIRGLDLLAQETTAAAIHAADPPGMSRAVKDQLAKRGWRKPDQPMTTLEDVVRPAIDELLAAAFGEGKGHMDAQAQEQMVADARERLQGLNEEDQKRMLDAVGADELNDAAVRKILLAGGALGGFGAAVSAAGFSAYILAAQASAFIPLMSGPAVVSTVAVLANPVTLVLGTAAVGWWATSSASKKVRTAVALRVIALMAIQGVDAGRSALETMLLAMGRGAGLKKEGELPDSAYEACQRESALLAACPVPGSTRVDLSPGLEGWLRQPAVRGPHEGEKSLREEAKTTGAIGVLTLGDVLYSAAMIDPKVIEAADFARAEDITGRMDFAVFADRIESMNPAAFEGAVSNVKGYVAERVVAAQLAGNGYQVEFPADSNQAGFDLIVEGQSVQVKCLSSVAGLEEHFSKYPDIPVIANSELITEVPPEFADRVFFVEGYSNEIVEHVTEMSLKAGADMLDPDVPVFVIGVIAVRQYSRFKAGEVTGVQAIEQIIVDGATRAGLAVAGGFAGKTIGLLMFGPAGALVFTTVLPVVTQMQSRRVLGALDKVLGSDGYRNWSSSAHALLDRLRDALDAAIESKLRILNTKRNEMTAGGVGAYVQLRIQDDIAYLSEWRARLSWLDRKTLPSPEMRLLRMQEWLAASTVHPLSFQSHMREIAQLYGERPSLADRSIDVALDVSDEAMEKAQEIGCASSELASKLWRAMKARANDMRKEKPDNGD